MRIYNDFFGMFGETFGWAAYERLNVYRAQVVFEHPILFGVFTATTFSFLYFSLSSRTGAIFGLRRGWAVIITTALSLSSGAFLLLFSQFGLVIWNWLMKSYPNRWKILSGCVLVGYVTIDVLSNRTPFEVFATYMTLDSGTAFWRVLIFKYGMDNVWANPVFGLGLRAWVRPYWMGTASVDNFWLLTAMRYGLVSLILLVGAVGALIFNLTRKKILTERVREQRLAILFVLSSLFVAVATVHLWNATYIYMMFLIGCSMWMLDFEDPPGLNEGQSSAASDDNSGPLRQSGKPGTGQVSNHRR